METANQEKQLPSRGLKQVKVDNWGTFFLQRLQQLYFEEELLDLTIKFPTSDITVQVLILYIPYLYLKIVIKYLKLNISSLIIVIFSSKNIFINISGSSFSHNNMHRLFYAT